MLEGLEVERQIEGFFMCWTQKEAYIKARGEGLSHPLSCFEVNCIPGDRAYLKIHEHPEESSRWTLVTLPMEAAYFAALAVNGTELELRFWQ
jgi:4'-phosphopantetheinyl transferase